MASILKSGGLALALIVLIIISSSLQTITVADARIQYKQARQLADCNSPIQGDIRGCGSGSGSGGSSARPRPRPSGPAPGSSRCKNGCCGTDKMGQCKCCP